MLRDVAQRKSTNRDGHGIVSGNRFKLHAWKIPRSFFFSPIGEGLSEIARSLQKQVGWHGEKRETAETRRLSTGQRTSTTCPKIQDDAASFREGVPTPHALSDTSIWCEIKLLGGNGLFLF